MVILYSHFQLITDCIEIISVYSSLEEAKQNHVKVLDAFVLCIIFKHSVKNFIYGTKFIIHALYLHLPSMTPSISYGNIRQLIYNSIETNRTDTDMPRLSIGRYL